MIARSQKQTCCPGQGRCAAALVAWCNDTSFKERTLHRAWTPGLDARKIIRAELKGDAAGQALLSGERAKLDGESSEPEILDISDQRATRLA